MTDPTPSASSKPPERVRISCPGCGRNDFVAWPEGQPTFHWKCFNCSKEFDLSRQGAH
jgi:DNA-directed RNA polymerase subunit RPC12/RpoP